ncbi:MAG: hypothetical protein ICV73_08660 [Acetobacteraceae bacterium]|nr:hypothetical protein [Acetobacteraceae bacterium]
MPVALLVSSLVGGRRLSGEACRVAIGQGRGVVMVVAAAGAGRQRGGGQREHGQRDEQAHRDRRDPSGSLGPFRSAPR